MNGSPRFGSYLASLGRLGDSPPDAFDDEEVARHIAYAEGPSGPCIDYLIHTVAALDKIGHRSGPMHDLLNHAWELRGGKGRPKASIAPPKSR